MRIAALLCLAAPLVAACATNNTDYFEQCELDLVLEPTSAAIGEQVVATGTPQTDTFDTNVRVEGVEAEVVEVVLPDACATCEDCRLTAECGACETCEACEAECSECAPTLTFTVPEVEPGPAGVVVQNRYGSSLPLSFEVLTSTD